MKKMILFLFLFPILAVAQPFRLMFTTTNGPTTVSNIIQSMGGGAFTNPGPTTIYGSSDKTNAVYIGPGGEVVSNGLGQVNFLSGNQTNSGNVQAATANVTGTVTAQNVNITSSTANSLLGTDAGKGVVSYVPGLGITASGGILSVDGTVITNNESILTTLSAGLKLTVGGITNQNGRLVLSNTVNSSYFEVGTNSGTVWTNGTAANQYAYLTNGAGYFSSNLTSSALLTTNAVIWSSGQPALVLHFGAMNTNDITGSANVLTNGCVLITNSSGPGIGVGSTNVIEVDTPGTYKAFAVTTNGDSNFKGTVNATNGTVYIGLLNFPADVGGPLIDLSVTATTTGGTKIGYTNRVDGNDALRIYGASDGAGAVTNLSVDIKGVSGAIAANAGYVGEVISSAIASGSATSLTTATAKNVTTISLTAGDWSVSGNINFSASTATVTGTSGGINTTSATVPTDGTEVFSGVQVTLLSENDSVTLPAKQINVAATTTVYLVGSCTFSAGTVTAFGQISARRVR